MRLDAAQRRRDLAQRDLVRAKGELDRLRGAAKASKAAKQRLADAAIAEANWLAARPQAAALLAMTAGPLTPQVCQLYMFGARCPVADEHCLRAQATACSSWITAAAVTFVLGTLHSAS